MAANPAHPPPPPHARFVTAPETIAAVQKRLLSRGVSRQELEDETQNVFAKLWVAKVNPTLDDTVAMGRHIAGEHGITVLRRITRRRKRNAGPTDAPDDHVHNENTLDSIDNSIDAKRQLDVLRREYREGRVTKRQLDIVTQAAEGYDHLEIGKTFKLAGKTVRNDLWQARKTSREAWARHVALAAFTLAAAAIFFWLRNREREARIGPDLTPSVPRPSPEPTLDERAADLRRNALHECDLGHLVECRDKLDQAKELDPAGDTAPIIKTTREQIRFLLANPDRKSRPDVK